MARFLGGSQPVEIVSPPSTKEWDLTVVVPVEVTDTIMPGVVSLPHGWGHDRPGARLGVAGRYAGVNSNVLADAFALYVKTKNFHWHLSGRHFRDYHLLLDEHADQIFAITDDIAERARKIGGTTIRNVIPYRMFEIPEVRNRAPGDRDDP